ncbi:MAG TPA: hypothetical protein VJR50_11980 [Mycobacterium sp.]|nr:hypothetical protein [Mycobacterium sp.]
MTAHETQPETMSATDMTDAHRGAVPSSEPTFSDPTAPVGDDSRQRLGQERGATDHVGPGHTAQDDIGHEPVGHEPLTEGSPMSPDRSATASHDQGAPVHAAASTGSDRSLFGDGDLSGFRSRWTEVQAAFVDDPRDCVQKADGLVADVVDRLTAGFANARSGLEEQWSRGEQVSTEDLRLALQRYRDFFERLLAV